MENEIFISESFSQNDYENTDCQNWINDYPAINKYLKKGYSIKSFTVNSFPYMQGPEAESPLVYYLIVHAHLVLNKVSKT